MPMSDARERELEPWVHLGELIEQGDHAGVESYLDSLSSGDSLLAVSRLDEQQQTQLFSLLSAPAAAEMIDLLPDVQAADVIERLSTTDAAAIVDALPSDGRVDVLAELDDLDMDAILSELHPDTAADVRRMAAYAPDSAGGLMITEYLAFPLNATCASVVDNLRAKAEKYMHYNVQYVYTVDEQGHLAGVTRLRDLLLTPPSTLLSKVSFRDTHVVRVDDSLETLEAFFDEHSFFGVPVVDDERHMLGVVRRDHVEQAFADRFGSDYLKTQGIVGGEELRTMPTLTRSRRRLSWLSINIVLNIIAASVIAIFQDTLSAVITLAVFLPIISDMSGCSGNQAVAVSMRELSLGLVRPTEMMRVWLKEISVGVINGLVLGVLISIAGWIYGGNAWIGLVVGVALALNTMLAVSIGGTVPLLLRRLKVDPALASGPILTTVTDMCGFFFVLGFATLILPRLTAV